MYFSESITVKSRIGDLGRFLPAPVRQVRRRSVVGYAAWLNSACIAWTSRSDSARISMPIASGNDANSK
jgi:hypothetical protein